MSFNSERFELDQGEPIMVHPTKKDNIIGATSFHKCQNTKSEGMV